MTLSVNEEFQGSLDQLEGNSGPTMFTFTINRSGDLSGMVTASYAVISDDADAMDFVAGGFPSGSVIFADGVGGDQVVTIEVNGDLDVEADEAFTVVLTDDAEETSRVDGTITVTDAEGVSSPLDLSLTLTTLDRSGDATLDIRGSITPRDFGSSSQFNIAYIIDVSGSTSSNFGGTTTVGDQNGDGSSNTVLDAEIAGFKALTQSLIDGGLGGAQVSVIPFASTAQSVFTGTIGQDADANGELDVIEALESLDSGGGTNFEAPLQEAITFFEGQAAGSNVAFFLSDGVASVGSLLDEVATLTDPDGLDATIRAIGVGAGANIDALDIVDDGVDNDSVEPQVLDPDTLEAGLTGSFIDPVTVDRLELSVNGVVVQTLTRDDLVETPFGLNFTATLSGLDVNADDTVSAQVFFTDPDNTALTTTQTVESLPSVDGVIRNDDMDDDGGDPGMGGDVCDLEVKHVNDWFDPSYGGGYVATFELTITEDLLEGESTTGWTLDLDLAEGSFVNGWLDGFQGPVHFDAHTGTFTTVGNAWQPELRAGDTLHIGIQVEGAGFDEDDVSCAFSDDDVITDDMATGGLIVNADHVNDWQFGAVQQVRVENTGTVDINQWIVRLDLEAGELDRIDLQNVWGAEAADDGEDIFFFPADYTRPVEAGTSEGFGFQAGLPDGSGVLWTADDFEVIGVDDVPADLVGDDGAFFF
ncbi:MAG: cellulose binding domain-containing protein [Alphaproteobacteria bacterium]